MNSWLDILPSNERQRIREKYKMSAAAYEKLREKVRGPEELEEEMKKNEAMAALRFALETEPTLKDALKKQIEQDMKEQGMESVLESVPDELKKMIEQGQFEVSIDTPDSGADQMVVHPEGNISEKVALQQSMSNQYIAQFSTAL